MIKKVVKPNNPFCAKSSVLEFCQYFGHILEENLKASSLRLLDPFYDQFSVLYRGLVIQFLLNSSFIIKYDIIFDNFCYTISSYVSSLIEREGFRLENRVKPFDTGIICWCSFSEHGAGDAFFYTRLIVGF